MLYQQILESIGMKIQLANAVAALELCGITRIRHPLDVPQYVIDGICFQSNFPAGEATPIPIGTFDGKMIVPFMPGNYPTMKRLFLLESELSKELRKHVNDHDADLSVSVFTIFQAAVDDIDHAAETLFQNQALIKEALEVACAAQSNASDDIFEFWNKMKHGQLPKVVNQQYESVKEGLSVLRAMFTDNPKPTPTAPQFIREPAID